jgi:site-specific DNA-methyltransferase (adenine-specific)
MYDLRLGDCLEVMAEIPDGSVDLVLCDLPYGTTQCAWDSVIPFEPLWDEYRRIAKPAAPIVLTASLPFTTALVASNMRDFKYCWAWNKVLPRGHLNAKRQPLRVYEDVAVFYRAQPTYNPQKTCGHKRKVAHTKYERAGEGEQVYGAEKRDTHYDSTERYPTSIITVSNAAQGGKVHPTQKPVALMEYLIRTYTNEGETVLDNCMGSGTTGVACANTGRYFIGIERDPGYFEIARSRIEQAHQAHVA